MADVVGICNLALQKLGANRIAALTDNSKNARAVNFCYEMMRDRELRAHPWSFAKSRAVLAPLSTAPAFDYGYAFPLPADFLALILPNRTGLDWQLEVQGGQRVILTNDGSSINVPYIAKITDPTLFDPMFVATLSTRIAWNCCEELTQSNEKKKDLADAYKREVIEARGKNAIELPPQAAPPDTWDIARLVGGVSDINFVSQPYGSLILT